MKKILALVLCAAMMVAFAIPAMAAESSSAVTKYGEAVKADAGPAIDGVIDDMWGQATAYSIDLLTDGAGSALSSGTFKVLWNPNTIYVLFEVPDTTPYPEHADAHQRDGVEVKFDLENSKTETYEGDNQFRMTAFRDGSDIAFEAQASSWDASVFTVGYADSPTGYVVEMAVNMAKFPLADGMTVGMDFQINDNAEDAGRTACLAWNDDSNQAWQNPSYMGNITLLAAAAPVEDVAAVGGGEAADAEIAPVVTTTTAPSVRTGDSAMIFVILAVIMAGAFVVTRRVSKNRA